MTRVRPAAFSPASENLGTPVSLKLFLEVGWQSRLENQFRTNLPLTRIQLPLLCGSAKPSSLVVPRSKQ